jgi:putative intracellular protease/amidase
MSLSKNKPKGKAVVLTADKFEDMVVVDSNLFTLRWPMDLPAFMREVMNMVKRSRISN